MARSILYDAAGLPFADTFYQQFKWAFIASAPRQGFRLKETEIRAWLEKQLQELSARVTEGGV